MFNSKLRKMEFIKSLEKLEKDIESENEIRKTLLNPIKNRINVVFFISILFTVIQFFFSEIEVLLYMAGAFNVLAFLGALFYGFYYMFKENVLDILWYGIGWIIVAVFIQIGVNLI